MPNWCYTTITFSGKDAKRLHDDIEKWTQENAKPNGFGRYWLGNVVLNSGVKTDGSYRGMVEYLDDVKEKSFVLEMSSAWSPALKMWCDIIKQLKYDVELIYYAEEPGEILYSTNDPALFDNYYFDVYDNNDSYDSRAKFGLTKKEVLETLEPYIKKFEIEEKEINDIVDKLEEHNVYVTVEKIDFVDPEDYY